MEQEEPDASGKKYAQALETRLFQTVCVFYVTPIRFVFKPLYFWRSNWLSFLVLVNLYENNLEDPPPNA